MKPKALRGEHEAGDVLHGLRVRAGAGRVGGGVSAAVVGERRDGQRGIGGVVGRVVAHGDVVSPRQLVLRALGVGGIDDGDVAIVDEDLVAPAAEAILSGIFREHGDAVAAEPPVGLAEVGGGGETEDLIGGPDGVLEPHGLEVEPADKGIGNGAGGAIGARERGVGVSAEVGAGDRHAVGLDVRGVAEIGKLGDRRPAAGAAASVIWRVLKVWWRVPPGPVRS